MLKIHRHPSNPILMPNPAASWESYEAFNGNVIKKDGMYHMLYRAVSDPQQWQDEHLRVSSIGHAISTDGVNFTNREQCVIPEYEWERFSCEDPRVTWMDGWYYIFYTAISTNPPSPRGIRIGVAMTRDFSTIEHKHLVTPFNAKAMALFPEKVNGKYAVILTVDTDNPPAKIAIALLDNLEQLWDAIFWKNWYSELSNHTLALQRRSRDHVEVGAVPVKTDKGWLFVYSYIQNYFSSNKLFGIEAALLDLNNPLQILGKTTGPFLVPQSYPEIYGTIPNIIFPSGVLIEENKVRIYYGASDTAVCLAEASLDAMIKDIMTNALEYPLQSVHSALHLVRFEGNPILSPIPTHPWEAKGVLNAAVYTHDDTIYILYRAIDNNFVSTIGLATTKDGFHITKRYDKPIYIPRTDFEKNQSGNMSGCEDPRVTRIGDRLHMHYTAYNGRVARVAHTSIAISDFIAGQWNWEMPQIISNPTMMDKNSAVFPEKIGGKYAILHRLDIRAWIDFVNEYTDLGEDRWLGGKILFSPRPDNWDSEKVGIAGPPIKTELGWLLIYHGISTHDHNYRLGIIILDYADPMKILLRLDKPIIEPKLDYEFTGIRPGAIFSCGSAILNDTLFVYYGAGDSTLGLARISYPYLMEQLKTMMTTLQVLKQEI